MKLINKHNLAVAFAASTEESRYTLQAILATENETVATDGHILARVSMPAFESKDFPVIEGFSLDRNGLTSPSGRYALTDEITGGTMKTMKEKLEQSQPCWNREISVAQKIDNRKRDSRNRNARERYQAMRDLGLVKTPYGWE